MWDYVKNFYLRFYPEGGEGTMSDQKIIRGISTPISANQFTKEGHTFEGWRCYKEATGEWRYTDGTTEKFYVPGEQPEGYYYYLYKDGQKVSATGAGTGDTVHMYAQWTPNTYNITFNANGGTGTMTDVSVTYGESNAITANSFKKGDSKFKGWTATRSSDNAYYCVNTADATDAKWLTESEMGTAYEKYVFADSESITTLAAAQNDTVTLSVQWQLLGDFNKDETLSINDVTMLQKIIARIETNTTADFEEIGDLNGDGKVNIRDVAYIQLYLAKIITAFPVCE
jgi:hypothetical protein